MTRQRRSTSWVESQVAGARWLAFLATTAGYLFIWFIEPSRIPFSLSALPVFALIIGAVLYNLVVTAMVYAGWLLNSLAIITVLLDILLAAAAYYFFVPQPDLSAFTVDPIFFLALFPVIHASIRFHWSFGLVVGLVLGLVRAVLLNWGLPEAASGDGLLLGVFGLSTLMILGFVSGYLADRVLRQGGKTDDASTRTELQQMRASLDRAEALQQMTSTLGATLNYERVIEAALDVAESAMAEWGAKGQLVGMVFLFDKGQRMRLTAARHLPRHDLQQGIPGKEGIVARCLADADIVMSKAPMNDPELSAYTGIANCRVAAAVPLRAGFENYGAMVFSTAAFEAFDEDQLDLFSAIASRATLALHNALLYQNLQTEKDRIVAIEEEARHKLSRDLHDGPTQSISAIAMRVNFVRKTLLQDPQRMIGELQTIEEMALQTVKEIRHMLFTLRPLVLETQGLVPALHMLVEKIQQMVDLQINIREIGNASNYLDSNQSGVIFYIIEEALGNARKYSQASLVEVRLWVEENLFVAQVADNGVGFNPQEVLSDYESRGSLGMVNMRERAALIDGSLDVKSAPGRGTAITVVVPVKEQSTIE